MDKYRPLLQEIESQWPIYIHRGLAELVRLHPDEVFYAGAFWIFYCDYTVISAPTFGVNAESMVEDEVPGETSYRWAPAEWGWSVVKTVCDGMEPFYEKLSAALAGASHDEWKAVMAANEELIGRVSRSVTQSVRSKSGKFTDLPLPDNFHVFAKDVREDAATYNRQLRLSVDEALLPTLGLLASEE
jgi:hypothetical protein